MTDPRLVAWGDELVKLHNGFRRDLARLRATGDLPGAELRTHCLAFCDRLHAHHEGEEHNLFPRLAAEHPALAEVLDRLRAEHHVVARLITQIRTALETGGAGVAGTVDRLAEELEAHLDHEEEYLVPVLNQMTDLAEDV